MCIGVSLGLRECDKQLDLQTDQTQWSGEQAILKIFMAIVVWGTRDHPELFSLLRIFCMHLYSRVY